MDKIAYFKLMSTTQLFKEAMASTIQGKQKPVRKIQFKNGQKFINGKKQAEIKSIPAKIQAQKSSRRNLLTQKDLQQKSSVLQPFKKRRSILEP